MSIDGYREQHGKELSHFLVFVLRVFISPQNEIVEPKRPEIPSRELDCVAMVRRGCFTFLTSGYRN